VCLRFAYGTTQSTDSRGRVNAKVRRGLLHLTADVPANDFLPDWASDAHKCLPAQLVIREAGIAIETVHFSGAYCVRYAEAFESGDEQLGSYICHFTLSDPDGWNWQVGGPTAYVAPAPREHGRPGAALVDGPALNQHTADWAAAQAQALDPARIAGMYMGYKAGKEQKGEAPRSQAEWWGEPSKRVWGPAHRRGLLGRVPGR
jgi:hypothetical protein